MARNREFYRDKASLGWNFIFPFFIIFALGYAFDGENRSMFKAGRISKTSQTSTITKNFFETQYIQFVTLSDRDQAIEKLRHHKIDILLDEQTFPVSYWVNTTSPKGYILERLLTNDNASRISSFQRQTISEAEIRYVDFLIPGVLGMNMMFSALFGVGYNVVRYRKDGVLRRLSVTPLKAFEFLAAQIFSRMIILLATAVILYVGCDLVFDFRMQGSYVDLIIIFFLGSFSLVSMSLIVASRTSSEEFASGVLNLLSWPMMFLSGVWFSLEGVNPLVQKISLIFPLTHLISGARMIMNDGASLSLLMPEIITMSLMSTIFLIVGSLFFRWNEK